MDSTRFSFGRNWRYFLDHIDESRVEQAEASLREMLGMERLDGLRFLDAGCGSGLFSLAAIRLGAKEVVSFDYDPDSVRCAEILNERFASASNWQIMQGDILSVDFLSSLGKFDIVYSWGVIHHTGAMWTGLKNIMEPVGSGGRLFIAIYNDQGVISRVWKAVKHFYVRAPRVAKFAIASSWYAVVLATRTIEGVRNLEPPSRWYRGSERGMSLWYDVVDWVGGYPFETATIDELVEFYGQEGFTPCAIKLRRGSGCNQLVLKGDG